MADSDIVPSGLSIDQQIAARALASGYTQQEAAELARVDEPTIRCWTQQDESQRLVATDRASAPMVFACRFGRRIAHACALPKRR